MHHPVRSDAVAGVASAATASPGRPDESAASADRAERRERPGLSAAEIEAGTRGAARVLPGGAVELAFSTAVTVCEGMGLHGRRERTFDGVTFQPLPKDFRAGGSDPVLSVFVTSIAQPAKVAKRLFQALPSRDRAHVQMLVGHVMMVVIGSSSERDRAELLALLD